MSDSPTPRRTRTLTQPPVPMRLMQAPIAHGLVVPFITLAHRDRSQPVWGALDPVRRLHAFIRKLCQVCGEPLQVYGEPFGDRVVLYLRPSDYLRGIAVEPGVHPECGRYSQRACPTLAGRSSRYNPASLGERLTRCADPDCGCTRWAVTEDPAEKPSREGQPAEAWYEAWLALSDYTVVSDPGDDTTAPAFGVDIRNASLLKLRKIRDATLTDTGDRPMDLLAALIAARELFGDASHFW
ncbi:hypothetical protein [Nocardia sp. NPDC052112]|uniref:hypothetical protein n=1 Tax=Nocardia sp. NPDC052112 TaxID=3155646 RepID=UPI00341A28B4